MLRFIQKHHLFFKKTMLGLVILLECFKLSVSVTVAQSTGTTVYTDTDGESICKAIQIPPLGTIPNNALMTQSSCESIALGCTTSGEYRCIVETTPESANLVRYYCPNPGGQWQRTNTPCSDIERANALGQNTCHTAGAHVCVKGQDGVRGATSFQRYVCITAGSNWAPTSANCTEAEIDQALTNPSGVSGITFEQNIIGQWLPIPNTAQGTIECYAGTQRMCINGAYCICERGTPCVSPDDVYNWVTAVPTIPEQAACYNQRPIVLDQGEQLAPNENRCPVNATRCECISLVYVQDVYENGSPTFETIGPGERCGVADPLSMSVISRVFLEDGTVASRPVAAIPVMSLQDQLLRGGVEGAIDTFGADAVAYYAQVCSEQYTTEQGYLDCLAVTTPVGLAAGAATALSAAALAAASAWVAAQGGIIAVLQIYGYSSSIASLSAATGMDFITAKLAMDTIIAGSAALPIAGAAVVAFIDDLGPAGTFIRNNFGPVVTFFEDAAQLAGTYGDEAVNLGDDGIRIVSGTAAVVNDCGNNQVGLNTVSGVVESVSDPINEVVVGTVITASTNDLISSSTNCAGNVLGGGNPGVEGEVFVLPAYGDN